MFYDVLINEKIAEFLSKFSGVPALLICVGLHVGIYYLPRNSPNGFGYQGITVLLEVVLLITGVFHLRVPSYIKKKVIFFQQYCLGIYCIHMAVGKVTETVAKAMEIPTRNLICCFIIWILCVISCALIDTLTKHKARVLIN